MIKRDIVVEPGRVLELQGHLTPAFGGPAVTIFRLELAPEGKKTVLKVSDSVFGHVTDRTAASLESGWKRLFDGGLRVYAEKAAAVPAKRAGSSRSRRGSRR